MKRAKIRRPVVELVIAHRHGVVAGAVHEFGGIGALVLDVEERTLELVPRVQHQHRMARSLQRAAPLADLCRDARKTAEAGLFASSRRCRSSRTVDRLDPRVHVVRVEDGEPELCPCSGRKRKQRHNAEEQTRCGQTDHAGHPAPHGHFA